MKWLYIDNTIKAYNGIFVSPKLLIIAPGKLYSIENGMPQNTIKIG